ncbi:MAG TPA: LacI family DNA-binding transcriptional regulator [Cellulomonas sp.]
MSNGGEHVARRTTVYDVAARAGVSIATVSFAFRQPNRVKPATLDRVLAVAQEIGYVPSASARGLAHGRTGALGLYSFDLMLDAPQGSGRRAGRDGTVPSGSSTDDDVEADVRAFPLYVDEVQRGFELECWRSGHALLLGSGTGPETAPVTDLAGRADGLAVFPGPLSDETLIYLSRRIPVVTFSPEPGRAPLLHVGVDNRAGVHLLVDHLHGVHGLRDIAFVGSLETPDFRLRHAAFVERMGYHDLPVDADPVDQTDPAEPDPFVRLREVVAAGRLPQALVCANDQLALVVLDLFEELGVSVPQDVTVTGFDGILAGRLMRPSLTTVRQPMERMGSFAARALLDSGGQLWTQSRSQTFPARLLPRESCGCAS